MFSLKSLARKGLKCISDGYPILHSFPDLWSTFSIVMLYVLSCIDMMYHNGI